MCDKETDEPTAMLLDSIGGTVFTAGDNAYPDGSAQEFADCYDPSWGRHRARTRPSPGNHDYRTLDAGGYYGYFGSNAGDPSKGYYSYNVGTWHVIVVNSNLDVSANSTQLRWLADDLAANRTLCAIAYWHGEVDRIVVDLRNNGGGEPRTARPLIEGLAERPRFRNQRGRVLVIVGRRTFSAALTTAIELRRDAGAVVVGEPPRGKPNNPCEGRDVTLPRSGLVVTVSTQYVERDSALGGRDYLPVDVRIPVTFPDHVAGVDAALEAALSYPISGDGPGH